MDGSDQVGITAFNCPNCGAAVSPDKPSCCYCGSEISTRICAGCFGAVAVGMRHCPHCGKQVNGSENTKKASLQCPRCETKLGAITVGPQTFETCAQCGGLWVDKKAFQAICTREEEQEAVLGFKMELAPNASPSDSKQRAYIPCPNCGKLMNHKNFSGSGVVLDWCRDHGSWFDRGELQRIVAFIRDGGLRKAREREQLSLKEQEQRIRMKEFSMSALHPTLDPHLNSAPQSDPLLQFLLKMF